MELKLELKYLSYHKGKSRKNNVNATKIAFGDQSNFFAKA